jgi:hypothetical protein
MLNSSTSASVRVLPNNKVYRQLFDAQVFIEIILKNQIFSFLSKLGTIK